MSCQLRGPSLPLVSCELDQVARWRAFEDACPGMAVRPVEDDPLGLRYWQATYPEERAMRTLVRHTLGDLLDAVEQAIEASPGP